MCVRSFIYSCDVSDIISDSNHFYSKVFHVRPVTQGDVIRADAKEIPRIFQLLYAGEGEARRPDDPNQQDLISLKGSIDERPGTIMFKGKLCIFSSSFT